jgi:2-(1,2-epoxy-1,2-dihydrophenyl)acetyl-CoA isomerase
MTPATKTRPQHDDVLTVDRDGGIAVVTLQRPAKRNALNFTLLERLTDTLDQMAADPNIDVLVLTGEGPVFSSGADVTDMGTPRAGAGGRGPLATQWVVRCVSDTATALHRFPKPTIAAVNGHAVGAGASLALGCDIVLVAESACFSLSFVHRGLGLDTGATWLLPRLVGLQRARDLALRGFEIGAREAVSIGLALAAHPDGQVLEAATAYARELCALPPVALSTIKEGLNHAQQMSWDEAIDWEARAQSVCMRTDDCREAVAAFLERRTPTFTGR